MRLFSELKRRNVLRMAALYLLSAWLIMQVAEVVIGLANLGDWVGPLILTVLAVGFPVALILSWFYELTPEGITLDEDVADAVTLRHTRRGQVDIVIIAMLVAAVLLFAYDKWWPEGPVDRSIAVLAFANMSDDPAQDYLSDGIAEELLNALAKMPGLRVTSRSSSFSFKDQAVPVSTIAEQLGVSHVVEGSVRKSGDRLRITAQLVDAGSDRQVWSETYERDSSDLFAVQDDIARHICDALRVRLVRPTGEEVAPAVIRSAELAAYDAYLQGREILHSRYHRRYEEALELFLKALRIDPTFAAAHAQVAISVLLAQERWEVNRQEQAIEAARKHLARAEALDPDFDELHGARALLAFVTSDYDAAVVHAEKALEINPNYADALNWLHHGYKGLGRHEEAERVLDRMLVVDPLSALSLSVKFSRLVNSGKYLQAHAVADQMAMHGNAYTYWNHARVSLLYEGKLAEGLYWGLKLGEELGDNFSRAWIALTFLGEYDEVRRLSDEAEPYIAAVEGRWNDAIEIGEILIEHQPNNPEVILELANLLYQAGRFAEALPLYERFFASHEGAGLPPAPTGGPMIENVPVIHLVRLAETRRRLGDEDGARAAVEIARQENAKLRAAGKHNHNRDLAEALLAALDNDRNAAFAALHAAIGNGMRLPFFREPIFENLQSDARMDALADEFDAVLEQERAMALQLICHENPTPDAWRPLPATCEGVPNRPNLLEFRR